ncbi:MAG: ornithine cyclodeaminase family protein, partial [Thaumarchaeota archaeon]|nr:ornithine cyclodeaminase family protein [Nitrososphaerota archaeon]
MLLIREDDVKTLLTMEDCITAVEESYKLFGQGEAVMTPRENLWLTPPISLKLASAALTSWGYMGIYTYPGGYGRKGSSPFTTLLYNSKDGQLLAIIESSFLSWYRTGATSAVATKHLALRDSDTLGIIGTGRQAWTQLLALSKVMKLKLVKVYSRTNERREKFASDASREMSIDVKPMIDAKNCSQNADVLVTATTSKEPVFYGEWLGEG